MRFQQILCLVIALGASLLVGVGCQSPAWKSFENVKVGQDKSAVVENIGSPTKSRRWNGKDRWTYEFGDHPNGTMVREVHFENGHVVYVGPSVPPKITATEQDRVNASSNQSHDQRLNAEQERRDRLLGIARPKRDLENEPIEERKDPADQKIRESIYGLEPDPAIEKRKRAPVFVPVE